jgi:NOL1/NOP2/fmu family ribosome biogenesis protein
MKKLIKKLEKQYHGIHIFEVEKDRFKISAEHPFHAKDGREALYYWGEDYNNYQMGVHNELQAFVEAHDCWLEWQNPGVIKCIKE